MARVRSQSVQSSSRKLWRVGEVRESWEGRRKEERRRKKDGRGKKEGRRKEDSMFIPFPFPSMKYSHDKCFGSPFIYAIKSHAHVYLELQRGNPEMWISPVLLQRELANSIYWFQSVGLSANRT